MSRAAVSSMTAYALERREARVRLNQNESPFDLPREIKERVMARVLERPWNRYPDFETADLREAIAAWRGLQAENVLTGNGSNDLLAAAISTFVGPGTPVIYPRPTFALYEKLVTIAGGLPVPVDFDPDSGRLPVAALLQKLAAHRDAVVIVCSPNNPTGGALEPEELEELLRVAPMLLLDRAYCDFERRPLDRALRSNLAVFRTFSKAFGIPALRVGWLESTAENCREIRKVKLPYSLNVISEAVAMIALENVPLRDANVARILAERERLLRVMGTLRGITVFPTAANFITFRCRSARDVFEALVERGVLIRDVSAYPRLEGCLRVSVGSAEENEAFLEALKEVL